MMQSIARIDDTLNSVFDSIHIHFDYIAKCSWDSSGLNCLSVPEMVDHVIERQTYYCFYDGSKKKKSFTRRNRRQRKVVNG